MFSHRFLCLRKIIFWIFSARSLCFTHVYCDIFCSELNAPVFMNEDRLSALLHFVTNTISASNIVLPDVLPARLMNKTVPGKLCKMKFREVRSSETIYPCQAISCRPDMRFSSVGIVETTSNISF